MRKVAFITALLTILPLTASAADLLPGAVQSRRVHPRDYWSPFNVHTNQFDDVGKVIPPYGKARTSTVYFMSHSEMHPSPPDNGCPVLAAWQIEIVEFDPKTGIPPFRDVQTKLVDGGSSNDPAPGFDMTTGFLYLKQRTAYKWQSRVLATYQWSVFDGHSIHCEINFDARYWSPWTFGGAFYTP
ncbi:hypothetical protein [Rhizobium sp. BR 362]|uniref:hypothetical protein n=1 Tax=Rhizobium sp. BR 362 TaxID=3040670 RepID=UPI002F408D11